MQYLSQGLESHERVNLLLSLTKISSEPTISAIHDHLVKGYSESEATLINAVLQSNFNRAMKNLNEVAGIVERIKEIDLHQVKK